MAKLFDKFRAVQMLCEGRKVHNTGWLGGEYLSVANGSILLHANKTVTVTILTLGSDRWDIVEWEEYVAPDLPLDLEKMKCGDKFEIHLGDEWMERVFIGFHQHGGDKADLYIHYRSPAGAVASTSRFRDIKTRQVKS